MADEHHLSGQHEQSSASDAALERVRDLVGSHAGGEVDAYHAAELLFVDATVSAGLRAAANWLDKYLEFVPRALWLEPVPGGRDAAPQWAVHMVVETE